MQQFRSSTEDANSMSRLRVFAIANRRHFWMLGGYTLIVVALWLTSAPLSVSRRALLTCYIAGAVALVLAAWRRATTLQLAMWAVVAFFGSASCFNWWSSRVPPEAILLLDVQEYVIDQEANAWVRVGSEDLGTLRDAFLEWTIDDQGVQTFELTIEATLDSSHFVVVYLNPTDDIDCTVGRADGAPRGDPCIFSTIPHGPGRITEVSFQENPGEPGPADLSLTAVLPLRGRVTGIGQLRYNLQVQIQTPIRVHLVADNAFWVESTTPQAYLERTDRPGGALRFPPGTGSQTFSAQIDTGLLGVASRSATTLILFALGVIASDAWRRRKHDPAPALIQSSPATGTPASRWSRITLGVVALAWIVWRLRAKAPPPPSG